MNRRAFLKATITGIGVFSSISCSEKDVSKKNTAYLAAKSPRANVKARRHDTDHIDGADPHFYDNDSKKPWKGSPDAYSDGVIVDMKVTAYCPCSKCCGCYSDGITASGHIIKPGDMFVAADKYYPFNTLMHIPGYCWTAFYDANRPQKFLVKVLDRGGAIKGNHIDVFFNTHQEALNWGIQFLTVTVIFVE